MTSLILSFVRHQNTSQVTWLSKNQAVAPSLSLDPVSHLHVGALPAHEDSVARGRGYTGSGMCWFPLTSLHEDLCQSDTNATYGFLEYVIYKTKRALKISSASTVGIGMCAGKVARGFSSSRQPKGCGAILHFHLLISLAEFPGTKE